MWLLPSFRITYVQSAPGVTAATPQQQSTAAPDAAYLPSSITTLGFTAIAPGGQTLVQPVAGQPPLLTPALPITCHSHTSPGQTAGTVARQVNKTWKYVFCISYCTLTLSIVHNCVVMKKPRKTKMHKLAGKEENIFKCDSQEYMTIITLPNRSKNPK